MKKNWHHSEESRKKMSMTRKGKPHPWLKGKSLSEEHKRKISEAHKGKIPWNKDLKTGHAPWKGKKRPDLLKTNAVKTMFKIGLSPWNKGLKNPILISEKSREVSRKRWLGENNPRWRGGVYPEHLRLRWSLQHKEWSKMIKKRDNYTCILCGKVGGKLHADHIKPFALYPTERFELNNGQTLCIECHKLKTQYENKIYWSNQYCQSNERGVMPHEV